MSQHTEKHWYTRFGIEEPFPWVLFLLAPIWFPRLLWSRRHRIYVKRGPMGEPVPVVLEDGSTVQITSATGGTFKLTAGNGRFETLPYDATVDDIRAAVGRLFGQPATWIKVAGE